MYMHSHQARSAAYAYFQYDLSGSGKYNGRPNGDLCYHWSYYIIPDSSRFIRDSREESGEEILLPALSSANKLHCPSNQTHTALSTRCQGTGAELAPIKPAQEYISSPKRTSPTKRREKVLSLLQEANYRELRVLDSHKQFSGRFKPRSDERRRAII